MSNIFGTFDLVPVISVGCSLDFSHPHIDERVEPI